MDKAAIDDMKRQESLLKRKSEHDAQKLAIKNALLGIDTGPRNNKIVFEPPEPKEETTSQEAELHPVKANNKRKAKLFDDDEEPEEVPRNFKVKKQFAGKNGEKLFELQTRFQNDKRFDIDEKFVDNEDDTFDARQKYTREQLKERKKLRKEMENWDQNELKGERDNQLSILEGITGESTGMIRSNFSQSKPVQKGMLRYDPSKKDHWKYLDLVKEGEEQGEPEAEENKKTEDFEVSDEKFYKVSENLAQTLQNKTESKPFSIFEMLGVHHEDEVEEEPKKEEVVKVLPKLPAFHLGQAQFRYDSSDTDEEAEARKETKKKKIVQMKGKGGKYSKSGVWRHNFFIADGDERLKGKKIEWNCQPSSFLTEFPFIFTEAFAFIKKTEKISSEEFSAKRTKLKQVVKSKIRKARSDQRRNVKFSKKRKVWTGEREKHVE